MRENSMAVQKKVVAAALVVIVAIAFSPLMATKAEAKTEKLTLFKGQVLKVGFSSSSKVTLKSNKSSIVKVTKAKAFKGTFGITYKYAFNLHGKKNGAATLTASVKGRKAQTYKITVKSFPAGSQQKPVSIVGSAYKTVKSANGKKVIKVKATVWKGEDAKAQIYAMETPYSTGKYPSDSFFTDTGYTDGRTLYLIKYDYSVVKGYPNAKTDAAFYTGLGGSVFDKKWNYYRSVDDYRTFHIDGAANYVSSAVNGNSGTYYNALYLKNGITELRSDSVGDMRDRQNLGSLGTGMVTSGCVLIKLP